MIAIVDSGSTKTNWVFIQDQSIFKQITTVGFNPYYYGLEDLKKILHEDQFGHIDPLHITSVYFYGSGVSTDNKVQMIRSALKSYFITANTFIYHDIVGSARSLFGNQPGLACILGTGSNACQYDGKDMEEYFPSLGYMFGDEGSGTFLGKTFLEAYLKHKVPQDINNIFSETYKLSLEQILDNVYNQDKPNRFMASFSNFLSNNIEHPYIRSFLSDAFQQFFDEMLKRFSGYGTLPVAFTGSVAVAFSEILEEVATVNNTSILKIVKDPMDGLIHYHNNFGD